LLKKEKYQIIDVISYECKGECYDRNYDENVCIDPNSDFMKMCKEYMVNVVGPLPKNLHLEDIYAEYHASSPTT